MNGTTAAVPAAGNARPDVTSVAEAYLALLADRGVDYLFGNAGTDFAPIVEAMARAATTGVPMPQPITAAHENLAVAMAHGYAMTTGRTGAVMVHVSVGTANGICATMNAARENIPILFTAGRTPILEEGRHGHRTSAIHWGQEMFDQAGMVRELVKWDYELRSAEQVETVVDRALAAARSEPRGPVYLSLPREVLAAPVSDFEFTSPARRVSAGVAGPDPENVERIAGLLERSQNPLVITANLGRDTEAVAALADFAEACAVPVVQYRSRYLSLPADHPMHAGYEPGPFLSDADLILVLESDVPWVPASTTLRADCQVVHAGHDPLFLGYPIRGFRCDLAVPAASRLLLRALTERMAGRVPPANLAARNERMTAFRETQRSAREGRVASMRNQSPMHPAWVSHCISQVIGDDALVVNEYTLQVAHCGFTQPGSFFASSTASGLGWGFGAALGAKLGNPDRLVVATLGDGAYMFSNPVASHFASYQNDLPILTIVFNNSMWNAVRRATQGMYPKGHAVRSNAPAFTELDGSPAFETVCEAAGGYGERVEDPAGLPAALERAIAVVRNEGRQALLNVISGAES